MNFTYDCRPESLVKQKQGTHKKTHIFFRSYLNDFPFRKMILFWLQMRHFSLNLMKIYNFMAYFVGRKIF